MSSPSLSDSCCDVGTGQRRCGFEVTFKSDEGNARFPCVNFRVLLFHGLFSILCVFLLFGKVYLVRVLHFCYFIELKPFWLFYRNLFYFR